MARYGESFEGTEETGALAGELIVIEAGRRSQRGSAASGDEDLPVVRLPGGTEVWSADRAWGPVSLSVFP